jgi:hypothetical protein
MSEGSLPVPDPRQAEARYMPAVNAVQDVLRCTIARLQHVSGQTVSSEVDNTHLFDKSCSESIIAAGHCEDLACC